MRIARRLVLVPAALVVVAASAPLAAADFTFQVPVTITNVPSATRVRIDCAVSRAIGSMTGVDRVADGTASATVTGGSYSGTIAVEANASGINPASSARYYSCSLTLYGRGTTGTEYTASPGNLADILARAASQVVLESHTATSGPMPGAF